MSGSTLAWPGPSVPVVAEHPDDGRGRPRPVLVWRWARPLRAASSAVLGGGVGERRWVLNAEVDRGYRRDDPAIHLADIAAGLGLAPAEGTALMTAAPVRAVTTAVDGDVRCFATVGLHPVGWAAAPDGPARGTPSPGTINLVCLVPRPLRDGALVNAVITATEAKAQALLDRDVPGTGTATDAVVVLCPPGAAVDYAGPRSPWGARLARAVHEAVLRGIDRGAAGGTAS